MKFLTHALAVCLLIAAGTPLKAERVFFGAMDPVPAKTILTEYRRDPVAAQARWARRFVVVTGEIKSVELGPNVSQGVRVSLDDFYLTLDIDVPYAELKVGQQATLRCRISEPQSVEGERCRIIEPVLTPPANWISVRASDLAQEYQANAEAADRKWARRKTAVRGRVVDSDATGMLLLKSSTNGPAIAVSVVEEDFLEAKMRARNNTEITLYCSMFVSFFGNGLCELRPW